MLLQSCLAHVFTAGRSVVRIAASSFYGDKTINDLEARNQMMVGLGASI